MAVAVRKRGGRRVPIDHVQVRVEGLNELRRSLQLAERGVKARLTKEITKAAGIAAVNARARAPRGSGRDKHPGQLAGSIRVKGRLLAAFVGSPLVYAPIIEFGRKALHPGHGHSGPHKRKLERKPYLIPAVEETAPIIAARIGPAIQAALDEGFGGG